MARQYYCLVSGLPDLSRNLSKVSLSLSRLKEQLLNDLHHSHKPLLQLLFIDYDHLNLMNLLKSINDYNHMGNLSLKELDSGIRSSEELPDYMLRFISAYKSSEPVYPNLSWENQLITLGYKYRLSFRNSFLQHWFIFEVDLKNVVAAISCRKYNLVINKELIPVQGEDELYQTILQKEHTKDFGLSRSFPQIQEMLELSEKKDIIDREWWVDNLKWDKLNELVLFHDFSIEKILSYCIKLNILERCLALNKQKGQLIFNRLIQEISENYLLPKDQYRV